MIFHSSRAEDDGGNKNEKRKEPAYGGEENATDSTG